jgi:hypothetical protein
LVGNFCCRNLALGGHPRAISEKEHIMRLSRLFSVGIIGALALAGAYGLFTGAVAVAQNVACYMDQGGAGWHLGSGCTQTVESGGILNIASGGKLEIGGVDVTSGAGGSNVAGVAAGYKVARGETALDGSNPTPVTTGLATITGLRPHHQDDQRARRRHIGGDLQHLDRHAEHVWLEGDRHWRCDADRVHRHRHHRLGLPRHLAELPERALGPRNGGEDHELCPAPQVDVVTAADGSATVYSATVTGVVSQIRYVKDGSNAFSNGVDFTITAEATGENIWVENDVNASATRAPRQATHGTDGSASLYAAAGTAVQDKIAARQ